MQYRVLANRSKTIYLLNVVRENQILRAGFGYFSPFLAQETDVLKDEKGNKISIYLDERYQKLETEKVTIPLIVRIKKE